MRQNRRPAMQPHLAIDAAPIAFLSSQILHNWGNQCCVKIFQVLRPTWRPVTRIVINQYIIEEGPVKEMLTRLELYARSLAPRGHVPKTLSDLGNIRCTTNRLEMNWAGKQRSILTWGHECVMDNIVSREHFTIWFLIG